MVTQSIRRALICTPRRCASSASTPNRADDADAVTRVANLASIAEVLSNVSSTRLRIASAWHCSDVMTASGTSRAEHAAHTPHGRCVVYPGAQCSLTGDAIAAEQDLVADVDGGDRRRPHTANASGGGAGRRSAGAPRAACCSTLVGLGSGQC
ncbi:hypothetical protein GCM10009539_05730 [Cryptosporangium japonicum]|uniref:Uncharacterized protein n=1 Tax=Cryptosporangium japonicum TaxID=80872 RepID=A0ABP3D5P7_9ACTN